ncbi:hypothetical protein FIBSPDRAFT_1051377 [Athelia psychrophila]|uniref:Uncharacterized protein n=1 Tax=Athelia psychrophila TaxID=1759441 RepID=A0A165ZA15_9AGAM|nr:hypothetical protein FIBSPDRAFT_1051377 [Fibularhizoctonia sp. CBS 109695]
MFFQSHRVRPLIYVIRPNRIRTKQIWHTALKLIADKWQADLVTTQQTITALNGRLVEITITQEKNASLKATADKYQADLGVTPQMSAALNGQLETSHFQFQCQRDSEKVIAQADLTVAQETNAATGELEGRIPAPP